MKGTANGTSLRFWNNCGTEMQSPAEQISGLLGRATLHTTDVDGCKIAWQQWPGASKNATPLLLVHGGFGSWTHWAANLDGLCRERAVWTVDLPGLGSSGDMPKPWTTDHFAELLLSGWRSLVGAERTFEIAAFSFGAMISGHLAAMAAEQCARCTLIGASGFGDLHVQASLLPPPGPEVPEREANAIHRENLSRLMLYTPESIDDLAVYIHGDNLARHRFRSRSMAGSNDLAEVLPQISARLVGIWGDRDVTAGGAENIEARRRLFLKAQPDAQFHVLENIGHWAMYETPKVINRLILDLL
jgi:pimeloyl-ACP methyl ester carboxylesterase